MSLAINIDQHNIEPLPESSTFFGRKYGQFNQLSVVGWNAATGNNIRYFVKCGICSQDPELFGNGIFKSSSSGLSRCQLPCGCGVRPSWSKEQYFVRCVRKAQVLGYEFKGFALEWAGRDTKLHLSCAFHGDWNTGSIGSLLHSGMGCPRCRTEALRKTRIKDDSVMIASFFASGQFHSETRFSRSLRKDSENKAKYWYVYCPLCCSEYESLSSSLQSGHLPCDCSPNRQRQAYINFVSDSGIVLAVKFGIANNAKERIKRQQASSPLDISQYKVYQFTTKQQCLSAERECKEVLECGIVQQRDMPDGYTETTYPHNVESVIRIYEKHGGVEI